MRYIKKDVIVDAFRITSVGPETVAGISQPALSRCTLENGDTVDLHAAHTGFALPQVGDYYVPAAESWVARTAFEAQYSAEMYGQE